MGNFCVRTHLLKPLGYILPLARNIKYICLGHLDDAVVHLVVFASPAPERIRKAVDLLEIFSVERDHAAEVPDKVYPTRCNVWARTFDNGRAAVRHLTHLMTEHVGRCLQLCVRSRLLSENRPPSRKNCTHVLHLGISDSELDWDNCCSSKRVEKKKIPNKQGSPHVLFL